MTFGENLVNLRKIKGISQEQLAEVLGLTRQTISKWELNQSTPDLQHIVQMCEYFEVSADYLIKGKETASSDIQQPESEQHYTIKPSGTNGYKWLFILGLVLIGVSMLGMFAFSICASLNPWSVSINDANYEGLAGYLRGTNSQGAFAALNILFLSGIACAGFGIFKQLYPNKNIFHFTKENSK